VSLVFFMTEALPRNKTVKFVKNIEFTTLNHEQCSSGAAKTSQWAIQFGMRLTLGADFE
tara:strand:- start:383 stop:559 length:177 start_codon:yes stop_codon:yes gene_type:complete